MHYYKPNIVCYRIAQVACWLVAKLVFRSHTVRNEIKDKQGAFVVIANHGAALDFVNLICCTARPMTFVISNSFFNTLPIKGFLEKLGVIPKQQFQTTVSDLKRMKAVIDAGQPLVIYPAGLMCEDGLSTPIPTATYKFLKWLSADVYVARSGGTYFVMPKWAKNLRPGKTTVDIYQLITKADLTKTDLTSLKTLTDTALLFDFYREQEKNKVKYLGCNNISGLEQVLYMCPHCKSEYTISLIGTDTLKCTHCGYTQTADEYGFLHKVSACGKEVRYISDWSRLIYAELKEKIANGYNTQLSSVARIQMIDYSKNKFVDVGIGSILLTQNGFEMTATIAGDRVDLHVPIDNVPSLPFSPGKHLEIQNGKDIYRCVLENGTLVMKFINMVKIFHELSCEVHPK